MVTLGTSLAISPEINYSKATIFHYLGLMAPILLKRKKSNYEEIINLKCGIGAGIEPRLHQKFEKRFKST